MKNYFIQAQKVRQEVRAEFEATFRMANVLMSRECENWTAGGEGVDVLLTPATLRSAPELAEGMEEVSEGWSQDRLLVPASLAGLPAIVLPVHPTPSTSAIKWPVAVQLIAQWGAEHSLLSLASCLQQFSSIHHPPDP